MKKHVYVFGAGISGCTIARLFAEDGHKVTIFERRNHVGGNVYDTINSDGIRIQPYGPHIFHTNNREVFEFLSKFTKWMPFVHRVEGYINNVLTEIPFNFRGIEQHFDEERANIFKSKLLSRFKENQKVSIFELRQTDDEDLKVLADFIYKNVFEFYSKKQWGFSPEKLGQHVIERVPVCVGYDNRYFSDTYQCQPMNGYSLMINNMLAHPNIIVKLSDNTKVTAKEISGLNGLFIYTGSIDELFDYKYGKLQYRSLKFKFKTLNKERYQQAAVVNYNTSKRYTRITESKLLYLEESDKTTICKEYPSKLKKGLEPYYPIPTKECQDLYDKYANECKDIDNLYLLGRLGTYKYLNIDAAVAQAIQTFRSIKEGDKNDT